MYCVENRMVVMKHDWSRFLYSVTANKLIMRRAMKTKENVVEKNGLSS